MSSRAVGTAAPSSADAELACASAVRPAPLPWSLWVALAVYCGVFFALCMLRFRTGYLGDADYGIFDQGFWTTIQHGQLLANTYEGGSHFRIHNSPVFLLLVPFYWLWPGVPMLLLLQTLALALGAVAVYRLGCHLLSPAAAMSFALAYLFYHPMHGVNYDQINELAYVTAPLLMAFYALLQRRMGAMWGWMLLVLATKEDMAFLGMSLGLYLLLLARREHGESASSAGARALWQHHLVMHGLGLLAVSLTWLLLSLKVVFPYFRAGQAWPYFSLYYPDLGSSLSEALCTIVLHPSIPLSHLLDPSSVGLFFELVLPLAGLPLLAPLELLVALPTYSVFMLSSFGGTHNSGARYMGPLVAVVFVAALLGAHKRAARSSDDLSVRRAHGERLARRALGWSLLAMLLLDLTPLRFPFKHIPWITEHVRRRQEVLAMIPPESSVSTQADFYSKLTHRIEAYTSYHEGTEYILVDTSPLYDAVKRYREAGYEERLPALRAQGRYQLVTEVDGILLLRRVARAGSVQPVAPPLVQGAPPGRQPSVR